jgi:putative hemolysin
MEIALLFALILLNGLCAMSELALVSARKVRLQKLMDQGDRSAAAPVKLGEDPARFSLDGPDRDHFHRHSQRHGG